MTPEQLALWEAHANAETDPKVKAQMLDIVAHVRRDSGSIEAVTAATEFLQGAMRHYTADALLEQQLSILRSELGPLIEKLLASHPRMEMLLAHGIGLLTSHGVLDVVIVEHEERLKAQAAHDLLLEDCRQFIFDAFDQHGLDLHEDGCDETDDCGCPRIKQANDLLRGWVAK